MDNYRRAGFNSGGLGGTFIPFYCTDTTPASRYRTGSGSVINAVGRIVLIPLTFVFGVLSNQSVFIAGWMLVVLSGLAVFVQLKLDEQASP